jgi:hypothetical protein
MTPNESAQYSDEGPNGREALGRAVADYDLDHAFGTGS